MIATALVEPPVARHVRPVPLVATVVRVVGVLLCLGALGGSLAWFIQLSPLHFSRWRSVDTIHNLTVDEPGRYVIFEEGDGAADRLGVSTLTITVRSTAGRPLSTDSLLDGAGRSEVTYHVPFVQGRALVSFDVDRAGHYLVLSFPSSSASSGGAPPGTPVDPGSVDLSKMPPLAIAREGEPSALGDLRGLLAVGLVPLLGGVAVLLFARAIWPSPLRGAARTAPDRKARRAARRSAK